MTAKFRSKNIASALGGVALLATAVTCTAQAQTPAQPPAGPSRTAAPVAGGAIPPAVAGIPIPAEYTIGPDDVLSIVFWRDKDMTTEAAVRPDGMISLPLINDVHAAGLTPGQLKDLLVDESKKYIEDPSVTVVVKQINSRKVYITGEVNKPGPYPLTGPTTVLQLLSIAGGVKEYAHLKKISIVRNENGKPVSFRFNYEEVINQKNLKQNIALKPGDTIIVP
jgi:polysaccharide export outer membrane protein